MKKKLFKGIATLAAAGTLLGSMFGLTGCGNKPNNDKAPDTSDAQMEQQMQDLLDQLKQAQKDKDALADQIKDLEAQLAEKEGDNSDLSAQLSQLQDQYSELDSRYSVLNDYCKEMAEVPYSAAEAQMSLSYSLNNLTYSVQVDKEVEGAVNEMNASVQSLTTAIEEREGLWSAIDAYKDAALQSKDNTQLGVVRDAQKAAARACLASGASKLLESNYAKSTLSSDGIQDDSIVNFATGRMFSAADFVDNRGVTEAELNSNGLDTDYDHFSSDKQKEIFLGNFMKNANSIISGAWEIDYADDTLTITDRQSTFAVHYDGEKMDEVYLHLENFQDSGRDFDQRETYTPITEQEYVQQFQQWRSEAEKSNSEDQEA